MPAHIQPPTSPEPKFTWLDLIRANYQMLGNKKFAFTSLTVIMFVFYFNSILTPFLMGKVVDFFSTYTRGQSLTYFYSIVALITGLQIFLSYSRLTIKRLLGNIQSDITYETRVLGFEKLMNLSLTWHDDENTGNKFQRIQNGTQQMQRLLRMLNDDIYPSAASFIGIIFVFMYLSLPFVLLSCGYLLIFAWILRYYYLQTISLQNESNKAVEAASGVYIEGLGNILTLKSSGAQKKFGQNVERVEKIRKDYEIKLRTVGLAKWQAYQAFNGVTFGAFLLLIGQGVVSKAITVGAILVVFSYVNQLVSRAGNILDTFDQIIAAKSAVGRMMHILWTQDSVVSGTKSFPASWDAISLSDARFTYPKTKSHENRKGLDGVNLTVKKFQKIGICGQTGSGKSTIAKIMMGLYQLDSGKFEIGDVNYYDIKHTELTRHSAIVLQDAEMFNMSVRENITLMRNVSDEQLQQAIEIAQLESVIEKLPDGLETLIGEKGYHFSGGERQRVGIARAICRDPEIIVFDEATSSLDSATESRIQEALEKKLTKKTLIFIAHRISTLKNVDVIYVFDKGSIVESGSYAQLIRNKKSLFSTLYSSQEKS